MHTLFGVASSSGDDDLRGAQFTDRDMHGAQFRMVDLRDSWFRTVDLRGVHMRGVALVDADVDGEIEGLRIWGVEVAPLVEAELDRRHPERVVLRATEPADLRAGWAGLEAMWAVTVDRVASMAPGTQELSVEDEWSFAQTLRHLVLATDVWLGWAILRRERPFHPLGVRRCATRGPGAWRWCATTSVPSLWRSSRPREPTRGAASGNRASSTACG